MKKLLGTLSLMVLLKILPAQDIEVLSSINYMRPSGGMSNTIKQGGGLTLEVSNKFKSPFSVGLEFSITSYGYQREKQQYTFDNGSVTEAYVNVSNYFLNMNATGRYFLRNDKPVNPYLSAKLGYTWYRTRLSIEDPADQYSCHPLESDILKKDGTITASLGGGVRIDFSAIFKSMDSDRIYLDVNAHFTKGGKVQYMNVNHTPSNTNPGTDVMAKFINTDTQVIHEHHVGYVYTNMVLMTEYRLGVVIKINP